MRSKGFPILGLVLALALAASAQTKAGVKQEVSVAHQQSPRFLQIVNESRKRVRETSADEVKARQDRGEKFTLIDVREESEFAMMALALCSHGSRILTPKLFSGPAPSW